jgi:5-methylcytosine-specific restriction enzyme A
MRYPRIRDTPDKHDKEGNLLCRNCDNQVSQNRRHYCSEACMESYVRNHYWFYVRKDVLKRDKYKCSICGEKKKKRELDVDHIIPIRIGGQLFDKINLRTLCKECHRAKSLLDSEALDQ